MEPLHFEARGTFRVTPEALWPLVSDTARMNRAIGSPPVVHTITPVAGGGSRLEGEIRLGGLAVARYVEHPFRWEAPHGFVVVRELAAGPLARIRAEVCLTAVEGGTKVVVIGDFLPRTAIGVPVAQLFGPRSVNGTIRQCRSFERYLRGEADQPYPQLARLPRLPWLSGGRETCTGAADVDALVARGLSREAVELLRRHLAEAPDEDVAGMGAFELADTWGLDRHETLGLFLHATAAGLLTMRWDVLCPNCRVSKAHADSLHDLATRVHCETCNISFDAAFDRSVEVRFSVAPTIRTVFTEEYCVGGPMNTPHVLAQTVVPPGGSERLRCQLQPGPYRLRSRAGRGRLMLTAGIAPGQQDTAESALSVTLRSDGVQPAVADVLAGPLVLNLVNATDREQVVLLEGSLWRDTVVTAATVCANQQFRELFPKETLAPGVSLGIESLAFLVVEQGPTPQPPPHCGGEGEDAGLFPSPSQWGGVRGGASSRAIADHHGALVRTDGLTTVATFTSARDAVAASLRIQRELPDARIGLHQGACIVANVDGRLDYVGRTVDIAVGLARAGRAGELIASLDVSRAASVPGLFQTAGLRLDDALLQLPDTDERVPVVRIVPGGAAPPPGPVDVAPVDGSLELRDWLARRHGPLLFDYCPGSYAGERIDAIVAAYASALDRITTFLERDAATLPPLRIRLLDGTPADAPPADAGAMNAGAMNAGAMNAGAMNAGGNELRPYSG